VTTAIAFLANSKHTQTACYSAIVTRRFLFSKLHKYNKLNCEQHVVHIHCMPGPIPILELYKF